MAIKIPIITVFDNKGLRAAQYQLNKVSGSFSALGRNFAIAGTAIGAFATGLGVAVKAASNFEAEYEGVNQVFGAAAKSVQAFAAAASKTAGLSETAALQGAKTFGLFAKSAQLGEEEAAKFATSLVQLAGDLGSFNDVPTEEALAAIQSGLMGQAEPLRKFGVFLTDTKLRAEAQAMAIYDGTGALNDQQKMLASYSLIMKDTKIQQGDFVKYQDTFGNAFKTVQTDIQNITKDIGMELLPVIAEVTPIIGDLARELGGKLAAAVKAVDWKSLIGSIVDFFTFIVTNIETITRFAVSLFVLNTAFNAVRAASGLFNAAMVILKATFTVTAGQIALTTGALKLFRAALITTGIGAFVVALGFIIEGATETDSAYRKTTPVVTSFGTAVLNSGKDAEWAAGRYGVAKTAIDQLNVAAGSFKGIAAGASASDLAKVFGPLPKDKKPDPFADLLPDLPKGTEAAKQLSPLQSLIAGSKKDKKVLDKTNQLIGMKLPKDVAQWVAASSKPVVALNQALNRVSKNGPKAIGNLTKSFQNSAAGQAAAAEAFDKAQADLKASQDKADQEAAEKLARQEATYKSFAASVANAFASIKDSILSAFDLPSLGTSTDSIIRNMGKLLAKTREFSSNITQLSSMGLDPQLLQQIISQGPIAGARLAAGLVAGGASGLAAINTGYSELSGLGSSIGMTGTNAAFGTSRQQNIYNIEVNGGVGSGATIGQAIVDAIKAYERTSGAVWQGA